MSVDTCAPTARRPLLKLIVEKLADKMAARLEPVKIEVAQLDPDVVAPMRAFLNGAETITVAQAHRMYTCYEGLMYRRKLAYSRQIEVVKSASRLEQEVTRYQLLAIENRR